MQQNMKNIELEADKALAEKLFSKQAFDNFDTKQGKVPTDYFERFETQLLINIASSNTVKKIRFTIPKWGQLAIAASFFTIIASTYLLIQTSPKKQEVANNINIQDIATSEIDAYVKENEVVAEIDWQAEINREGSSLESLNTHLIKDSNTTQ
jgi:hypothetical protein